MVCAWVKWTKLKSYNFPQNRVTDHRTGITIHGMDGVLTGEIEPFIDELALRDEAARLAALGS